MIEYAKRLKDGFKRTAENSSRSIANNEQLTEPAEI